MPSPCDGLKSLDTVNPNEPLLLYNVLSPSHCEGEIINTWDMHFGEKHFTWVIRSAFMFDFGCFVNPGLRL